MRYGIAPCGHILPSHRLSPAMVDFRPREHVPLRYDLSLTAPFVSANCLLPLPILPSKELCGIGMYYGISRYSNVDGSNAAPRRGMICPASGNAENVRPKLPRRKVPYPLRHAVNSYYRLYYTASVQKVNGSDGKATENLPLKFQISVSPHFYDVPRMP